MIKFAIYTFLGFIMESIYISILNKKILFSGLLKGPCIPIYGFGALLILNISGYCYNNIDVFFYSLISCTCLEYLTHYFLLKDSNIEIWNYSKIPHNYSARICMFYSIMWGFLGICYASPICWIAACLFTSGCYFYVQHTMKKAGR